MSTQRLAIIDGAFGVSGDMLLGALVSLLGDDAWLKTLPARLGLPGVTVEVEPVLRCAIRATKVTVRMGDGSHEGPNDAHGGNGHGQHGHHHLPQLMEHIDRAELHASVAERARSAFRLLAEAEGVVHGIPPESVALHEVGAADALVDIVGVLEGFRLLAVDRVAIGAVALGSGYVRAAHGTLPVPAPATTVLLKDMSVSFGGPAQGEATTPTGAVLVRTLSSGAPPLLPVTLRQEAWGAGERDPSEYPNAVRVIVGDVAGTEGAEPEAIVVLATDIDDMPAEYLDYLRRALIAAGALDVQMWSTHGKRNRISFRIEALARPDDADAVADAMVMHSTTLGVRRHATTRRALARRELSVTGEDGQPVRLKASGSGKYFKLKPELVDLERVANAVGSTLVQVARELHLHEAYIKGLATDAHERPREIE